MWRYGRPAVLLLALVLVVSGAITQWGRTQHVMWEFALRPVYLPAETVFGEAMMLRSPCDTLTIEVDSVILGARELAVQGRILENRYPDYTPEGILLSLSQARSSTNRYLDVPGVQAQGWPIALEAGAGWEWRFPHAQTKLEMGQVRGLLMVSFRLVKEHDRNVAISVDELLAGALRLRADDDGTLRAEQAHLADRTLEITWSHEPSGRLRGAVERGLIFSIDARGLRNQNDRGLSGSTQAGGAAGEEWISTQRVGPVPEGTQYLTISALQSRLTFHAPPYDAGRALLLTLPRRIMR